jgi:23S rRNA (guanosine2251-2'-O)-methyltransferase
MDLICGINPVLEALGARTRHFDRLLIVKGIRNRRISEAIARAGQMGVPLRFEPRDTLDRLSGGLPHQGLIAVVSAKPAIDLEDLLNQARQPGLVVVLDGVEDPRNLGAILRTVEASGADGVLLPERHSAGLSETVNRASAGALEHVRVARIGNVAHALETLKGRGYWIVGFDGSAGERWDAVDYRRPVAFVFGGEGRGIRRLVKERCDHLVALPLFGQIGSLNVSVAAGVALYEAIRQRGAMPSHVRPIPVRPAQAERRVIAPGPEDGEVDPGAVASVAAGEEELEADDPVSLVHIDEDEWSTGPTVLTHAGVSRHTGAGERRRPKRRDRNRRFDRGEAARTGPPEAGEPAPPQAEAGAASGGSDPADRRKGRRRRRRRRGSAGPHAGGPPPIASNGGEPPFEGSPSNEPAASANPREPGSAESGGGAPPGGGPSDGHRRRRRRRRR